MKNLKYIIFSIALISLSSANLHAVGETQENIEYYAKVFNKMEEIYDLSEQLELSTSLKSFTNTQGFVGQGFGPNEIFVKGLCFTNINDGKNYKKNHAHSPLSSAVLNIG